MGPAAGRVGVEGSASRLTAACSGGGVAAGSPIAVRHTTGTTRAASERPAETAGALVRTPAPAVRAGPPGGAVVVTRPVAGVNTDRCTGAPMPGAAGPVGRGAADGNVGVAGDISPSVGTTVSGGTLVMGNGAAWMAGTTPVGGVDAPGSVTSASGVSSVAGVTSLPA
jgi:hypothetical protein